MKSLTPFLFSILLFLSVIQQAAAVYDPTVGRWLSRDPLPSAEILQGTNLYAYVRENPINSTDRYGLFGVGLAPIRLPGSACLGEMIKAFSTAAIGNNFPGALPQYPGVTNDKYQHCVSSCRLAGACGDAIANALGQLKEGRDALMGEGADPADLAANARGRQNANSKECPKKTCEEKCHNE